MSDRAEVTIHPSSVVEDGASLGNGVRIGPFCHIGADVTLGDDVEILSHVSVQGITDIGAGSRLFPFASIGHEPQDLKFHGERVTLTIGKNCLIREGVTMNPGTEGGGNVTEIGDNCTFLANAHVAHDCRLGNNIIFSNSVMLAGHCTVGDNAIFGGGSAVHQFCRIGNNAFIGGLAGVEGDIIPFGTVMGNRAKLAGLNLIGMKRSGMPRESIHAVRAAYKSLFDGSRPVQEMAAALKETSSDDHVLRLLDFVLEAGDRALTVPAQ